MTFDELLGNKPAKDDMDVEIEKLGRIVWEAATKAEREACIRFLNITRPEISLIAGEITGSEWRLLSAVLANRIAEIRARSNK